MVATPGWARVYIEDERWQAAVVTELGRSQAVVVQPGSTAGVRWELEQIREHVAAYRVLFCLVSFWKNPQAFDDLATLARETLRLELPRVVPFLERPCFIYFEQGWIPQLQELSYRNPILWPLTADASDLRYTLQPFVQGMHGGEREIPRRPRWTRGAGKLAAGFAALLMSIVIVEVTYFGVAYLNNWITRSLDDRLRARPEPAQPRRQPIAELVARSPRITLAGRAVPYQFEVPQSLIKVTPEVEMVEHWRKSADGLMSVRVVAHDQREDLSTLAKERLEANTGEGILEARLQSTRTVNHAGVDWVEGRVVVKMKNGISVWEIARGTSGPNGTVLVIVDVVESQESNSVYLRLTDEVLQSFRFVERPDRGVTPPAPGAASGPDPRPDRGVRVIRGSVRQGPVWDDQNPKGYYAVRGEAIRFAFDKTIIPPDDGSQPPATSRFVGHAEQLQSDLHVSSDAYFQTLLEPRTLLTLKFTNIARSQHGYLVIYRAPDGSFYHKTNGNDPWKPLPKGHVAGGNWIGGDRLRVHIEVIRPDLDGKMEDREVDYRFRLEELTGTP